MIRVGYLGKLAMDERAAVARIIALGGKYRYDRPPGRNWLEILTGREPIQQVAHVDLDGCNASDEDLRLIGRLYRLEVLIVRSSNVTDAGVSHLGQLEQLRFLDLSGSKATGAGLKHVRAMTGLTKLDLRNTAVGDDAMEHVSCLYWLGYLDVSGTRIGSPGVATLSCLTRLQYLLLENTRIDDSAVPHLRAMLSLHTLDVAGTSLSDSGFFELWDAVPSYTIFGSHVDLRRSPVDSKGTGLIYWWDRARGFRWEDDHGFTLMINLSGTRVTDKMLEDLHGLKHVLAIDLQGTRVTENGVKKLKETMPKCWVRR
ncbi:MAG: hypothetical protein HYS13_02870 [Planctomycetia bacterium]|nr:hypothetical protein [Planctomycetia bacterium]